MKKFKFTKKLTQQLSEQEIILICKLKKKYWKYSLKSHIDWFKKNILKNDFHFFLQIDTIKMYCCLRDRKFLLNKRKFSFYYLDTLCSVKISRYRVLNFLDFIMTSTKLKPTLTLCSKDHLNLYKLFGFKIKKNLNYINHDVKNYFTLICIPLKNKNKDLFKKNMINVKI